MRGWSRTSPTTSGSRSTPRCTAAGRRVERALLAHPLVGQHDRAERLTDLLLDAQPRPPGVGAMTRRRPSQRLRCYRRRRRRLEDRRPGARADGTVLGARARRRVVPADHRRRAGARGDRLAGPPRARRPAGAVVARAGVYLSGLDLPVEIATFRAALATAALAAGRPRRRQRHVRAAAGRHRRPTRASRWSAAPASTASADGPTARPRASRPSAASRATGAAAGSWGSRPSGTRPARWTAAARRRR